MYDYFFNKNFFLDYYILWVYVFFYLNIYVNRDRKVILKVGFLDINM